MWGGGGGFWGGTTSSQPGLPFAGIPSEHKEMVEKLLQREPASDEELFEQDFSHRADAWPPFGLWRFLSQRSLAIGAVVLLVAVETVLQQIGPRLTQEGIDHGITPRHVSVVVDLALAYV